MMAPEDLEVRVVEVKGHCPVYRVGDKFRILEGYKLQAEQPLCLHALTALMPYYVALSRGTSPRELGLGDGDTAYLQCLDPHERTGGGDGRLRRQAGADLKHGEGSQLAKEPSLEV